MKIEKTCYNCTYATESTTFHLCKECSKKGEKHNFVMQTTIESLSTLVNELKGKVGKSNFTNLLLEKEIEGLLEKNRDLEVVLNTAHEETKYKRAYNAIWNYFKNSTNRVSIFNNIVLTTNSRDNYSDLIHFLNGLGLVDNANN